MARLALASLRAYKVLCSPLFTGSCRFTPSCADYMAEAIRRHGLFSGIGLGTRRLARCRPGAAWGFDPVPPYSGSAAISVLPAISTRPHDDDTRRKPGPKVQ